MSDVINKQALSEERPLVTLALFSYNSEKYIREAVEGALSQTYSPLEIILSDDCSKDRTYEIMQEMASSYKGPHHVIVRRNERNLRVPGHVNKLFQLAHGELIVAAAGDDISLPHRVQTLTDEWLKHGKPLGVNSNRYKIDSSGVSLGKDPVGEGFPAWIDKIEGISDQEHRDLLSQFCQLKWRFSGASAAWRSDLLEIYGYLPMGVLGEDMLFNFRALLEKSFAFCPEKLIKYRTHEGALSHKPHTSYMPSDVRKRELDSSKMSNIRIKHYMQLIHDLDLSLDRGKVDADTYNTVHQVVLERVEYDGIMGKWWTIAWPKRVLYFLLNISNRPFRKWAIRRLLPFTLYCRLLYPYSKILRFKRLVVAKVR
ncbi:glycosyltransferase [Mariprofundus sp. EBB-1]|uniref:glycosyltransferase n=1 Tax=Mariprofundus sp. EBB-1 TaxID=2650971 RepID=UPI000EF1CCA3|nr:glycosyltransferase [Mariprofundus sp. EBB-1]RLL49707.1 glycosyltransferase [Mariprofundus sp. EBB-1]